jgi:hypothetical protein
MNVIAIRNSEDRYVVVDKDTGEILDDAQGYGFKTAEKAYKCFHYKHRSQEQRDKEKEIKAWIKDHKEFVDGLEDVEFYQLKSGGTLNSKIVAELLKESGLNVNFTAKEFLAVYRRR